MTLLLRRAWTDAMTSVLMSVMGTMMKKPLAAALMSEVQLSVYGDSAVAGHGDITAMLEGKRKEHYEKYMTMCEEGCGKWKDKLISGEEMAGFAPMQPSQRIVSTHRSFLINDLLLQLRATRTVRCKTTIASAAL